MIIRPYSFNNVLLNSTDYDTSIPRSSALAQGQVNLSYVRRAGAEPVYSGKEFQPVTLNLEIICLHDYTALQESLNIVFDVHDETPRQFIVQDTEDTSAENPKQYFVYATPKQVLGGHDGAMVTVTLGLDDPIWQSVTQNTQTMNVTATGDSTSVTANGNADSYPEFDISIAGYPGTGYVYNNYIQYKPPSVDAWRNRPLEIVSTTDNIGLDTAALVAAGKALANGDDYRVYVDGVERDRWFGGAGFNSTYTKVWINIDQPAKQVLSLKTAIASTDLPSTVDFIINAANTKALTAMPTTGRFMINSEEFTYTSKTIGKTALISNGITRAVRNTTAGNHSSSDVVTWLPYDINIVYGSSDATAPDIDDTRKPIINLTSSNNSSFVYDAYMDNAKLRSGIWSPAIVKVTSPTLSQSGIYTGLNDGGDTDPADVAGMNMFPYASAGIYKAETSNLEWTLYFPDIVASVSHTFERYQGTASWPALVGLYGGALSSAYKAIKLLPSSDMATTDLQTWVTGTHATTDLVIPVGTKYLKYQMSGSLKAVATDAAYVGWTSTTIGATNIPDIVRRGEQNGYLFDTLITNTTTGKSLAIKYPLRVGDIFYIVTDPNFPNAKFKGQIVNGAMDTNTVRADWLSFQSGANTITVTSPFVGNFSIVMRWRDRMNML